MNDEMKAEEISDETSIKEAEIIKEINMENDLADDAGGEAPKKRRHRFDFYIELALFLILGALVGISVKTEAAKRITIGFDDYKMKIERQDYDINQLQTNLDAQQAAAQAAQENAGAQQGDGQVNQGQGQNAQPTPSTGNSQPDGQGN
ncbi:MAG: hypothetical protein P4L62_03855 [Candidatus Pacebacteria bacterium]|nr:hypothetical protein [Candidatus Paceibacterota bacterium]MDR3583467.1 hypothetical protein [Candidatus Paceibacterota bacterium]